MLAEAVSCRLITSASISFALNLEVLPFDDGKVGNAAPANSPSLGRNYSGLASVQSAGTERRLVRVLPPFRIDPRRGLRGLGGECSWLPCIAGLTRNFFLRSSRPLDLLRRAAGAKSARTAMVICRSYVMVKHRWGRWGRC